MAYPYRAILCPIEFEDDPSLLALGVAKQIAADHGGTVHVLHVTQTLGAIGEPDISSDPESPGEKKARAHLEQIAGSHLAGTPHTLHILSATERSFAKAIIQVANEIDADLIIIKTHGRTGLAHLVLGSVTEEIVRAAPCPVMTLTSAAQQKTAHLRLRDPGSPG